MNSHSPGFQNQEILPKNIASSSADFQTISLDSLVFLKNSQDAEKEFLMKPFPKPSFLPADTKDMFSDILEKIKLDPLRICDKSFEVRNQEQKIESFEKGKETLLSQIYKQTLEINKLRSDNRLLAYELDNLRTEARVKKIKKNQIDRSELICKKKELIRDLAEVSKELEKKKKLAFLLENELKIFQDFNTNLRSYSSESFEGTQSKND